MNVGGRDISAKLLAGDMESLHKVIDKGVELAEQINAKQDASVENLKEAEKELTNPLAAKAQEKRKTLTASASRIKKTQAGSESALLPIEKIRDAASKFKKKNQEFNNPQDTEKLIKIRVAINELTKNKETIDKEKILAIVGQETSDAAKTDAFLQFLEETTTGEDKETIQKTRFEYAEDNKQALIAAKNIAPSINEVLSKAEAKGKPAFASPEQLRGLYQDFTTKTATTFERRRELKEKFNITDRSKVIKFYFHSLGSEFNSRGPSIDPAKLQDCIHQVKQLQTILGAENYIVKRFKIVENECLDKGYVIPAQLNPDAVADQFFHFTSERYPSPSKALDSCSKLGISHSIEQQVLVLELFRDSMRAVNKEEIFNIHGNGQGQFESCFNAVIEALSVLYDQVDEKNEMLQNAKEKNL